MKYNVGDIVELNGELLKCLAVSKESTETKRKRKKATSTRRSIKKKKRKAP